MPEYFRKPYGPGWALLGDAGYHKNPITGMGINDAFRDAELVATQWTMPSRATLIRGGHGRLSGTRDHEAIPVYEFTDEIAQLSHAPPRCSS